jgi:type II secretory pathway predicted ATPase ExeA/outer membrane protein OmpA-like peptidoglycan-associated protein
MYLPHYKLKIPPFSISPDPNFLWFSSKHREAYSVLKYGILEDKGFLALTGEIGTGKTLLINKLIGDCPVPTIIVAIPDPGMKPMELFRFLAAEAGMEKKFLGKVGFLIRFKQFILQAYDVEKKVLLILDEAQRLSFETLEQIRLLSNIEKSDKTLINIFFVGQNEFSDILEDERSMATKQRITTRYQLEPFTEEETAEYIRHRLNVAGAKTEIFNPDAITAIQDYSKGFPRAINIICDNALMIGFGSESKTVTADMVLSAANELPIVDDPVYKPRKKPSGVSRTKDLPAEDAILESKDLPVADDPTNEPILKPVVASGAEAQPVADDTVDEADKGTADTPLKEEQPAADHTPQSNELPVIDDILHEPQREPTFAARLKEDLPANVVRMPKKETIEEEVSERPSISGRKGIRLGAILFLLVFGSAVYFFYDSENSKSTRWKPDDILPEKKNFASEIRIQQSPSPKKNADPVKNSESLAKTPEQKPAVDQGNNTSNSIKDFNQPTQLASKKAISLVEPDAENETANQIDNTPTSAREPEGQTQVSSKKAISQNLPDTQKQVAHHDSSTSPSMEESESLEPVPLEKPTPQITLKQETELQNGENNETQIIQIPPREYQPADANEILLSKKVTPPPTSKEEFSAKEISRKEKDLLPRELYFADHTYFVFFGFNSGRVLGKYESLLGDIADTASKSTEVEIFIEGYTDAAGDSKHNTKLSELRATTIKNYFIGKGIHPSKIHASGMGSRNPLGSNQTAAGRRINRRVEIKLKHSIH